MNRNPPVGCEWNRWDLHVHTPESIVHGYPGADPWDAFLSDLAALPDGTVIGINDYLFVDGYKRVSSERGLGNLPNLGRLFPVIELRTDNLVGTDGHLNRINLHAIFSDSLQADEIIGQFGEWAKPQFQPRSECPSRGDVVWSANQGIPP